MRCVRRKSINITSNQKQLYLYNLILSNLENLRMLNSLLKKVKQQKKSQTQSIQSEQQCQVNKQQNGHFENSQLKIQKNISQLHKQVAFTQLKSINRVRYAVFNCMPEIWNKLIGCPISTWNYLPFGKRKVKQIDLRQGIHAFPQYLQFIRPLLNLQIPSFNHLLINHYPSNIGIMPHTDGPAYKAKVFVISLGGPAIINFSLMKKYQENIQQQQEQANVKVLLEDRSIHIFEEQAYNKYLHGINDFALDSIYLKQRNGIVIKSDLANFFAIKNRVQQMLQFSELEDENFALIKIENNVEYNWKLQIARKERISITIRQKYHN